MFDAEIAILVSESPNFIKRLDILFEYGLRNCKKHNVLVKLIKQAGHHKKDHLLEKYTTDTLKFQNVFYSFDEPAQKRFNYYLDLTEEDIQQARWFIFIDDDTVTDIDKTIENLDEWFDWTDNAYCSGELMNNHQSQEWEIASLMGKSKWYSHGKGPYHEWEICCLSQSALRKIKNNPKSNRVLALRSKIATGWGDHCMGLAARLAKIYPVQVDFLSANPMILESVFLEGEISHFHRIYQHNSIETVLPIMFNRNDGNLANKKILLCRNDHKEFVNLKKGGCVQGQKPIGLWTEENGKLIIYTMELDTPFVFDFEEESTATVENEVWKIHIAQ